MHEIYFKNFSPEEIMAFETYLRRVLENVRRNYNDKDLKTSNK